jgi:hypothetical protein
MKRYSYPEAARELGVKEKWLRDNIRKLPHKKLGRVVYFLDADLERIDQLFHHEPQNSPVAAVTPLSAKPAGPVAARDLKPLGARRSA